MGVPARFASTLVQMVAPHLSNSEEHARLKEANSQGQGQGQNQGHDQGQGYGQG